METSDKCGTSPTRICSPRTNELALDEAEPSLRLRRRQGSRPAARLVTVALDRGLASGWHNYGRHGPLSVKLAARRWRRLLNQVLSQSSVLASLSQ
jgi:hypothetical protein